MSNERYKWRLAVPGRRPEDTRDLEEEANVLQLTWMGAEMEGRTPGRQCRPHLKQTVCKGPVPSSSGCALAQAVLKEVL